MEVAALVVSIVAVTIAGGAFLLGEARERRRERLDLEREERDRQRFGMEVQREQRDAAARRAELEIPHAPQGFEPDGQHVLVSKVTVHSLGQVEARRVVVTLTVAGRTIAETEPKTLGKGGSGDVFDLRIPRDEVEHLQGAWITFKGGDWLITAQDATGATATWPPSDG